MVYLDLEFHRLQMWNSKGKFGLEIQFFFFHLFSIYFKLFQLSLFRGFVSTSQQIMYFSVASSSELAHLVLNGY